MSIIRALYSRLKPPEFYVETLDFRSGLAIRPGCYTARTRSLKPRICVEIGSARGKSACAVGLALQRNGGGKLFAIDPHSATELE